MSPDRDSPHMPADAGLQSESEAAAHVYAPVRPSARSLRPGSSETPSVEGVTFLDPNSNEKHDKTVTAFTSGEVFSVDESVEDVKEKEELQEFLDGLPLAKRSDKRYVKENYGRQSDRRTASGKYSNDLQG